MAIPKYVPNSIYRYQKTECRQMCMTLLRIAEMTDAAVSVSTEGVIIRRKRKPSVHLVREFCWNYILWFMERNNVSTFKRPLSSEIDHWTGFGRKTVRRALLQLEFSGSVVRENSKTYLVRKELSNRRNGTIPTAMAPGFDPPEWNEKQLRLGEHMARSVKNFEKLEEDEMQIMQETVDQLIAENRNLREKLAEMRGARNELKDMYETDAERTIDTYERGFDSGRDLTRRRDFSPAGEPEDEQPKPEIKLVPSPKSPMTKYDIKH